MVNFNGGALTLRSLRAVMSNHRPSGAYEVVLVDNASSDGVADIVAREMPDVRVIRSDENLGFAGGTNLGIGDLDESDFVALVNNDVTVPPDWLEPLARALDHDEMLGAASPKMLLDGRYRRVDLSTTTEPRWRADPRERGVRVMGIAGTDGPIDGVRYASGWYEPERLAGQEYRWSMPEATMFVPAQSDEVDSIECMVVIDADRAKTVQLVSGGKSTSLSVARGLHRYPFTLAGDSFDLINNVGSVLVSGDYAADRGWLEPDLGQYEDAEDVFAWCGGAVLLRSTYLRDTGVLDDRLFLYYEDLELSWRGRRRGWRYRYVPDSVVRHDHSATAQQDSPLARYFNERNRLLVLARHAALPRFVSAVLRFILSTGAYGRREVLAPVLRGERPRPDIVSTRLRALAGFAAGLPAQLRDRPLTSRSARRPA